MSQGKRLSKPSAVWEALIKQAAFNLHLTVPQRKKLAREWAKDKNGWEIGQRWEDGKGGLVQLCGFDLAWDYSAMRYKNGKWMNIYATRLIISVKVLAGFGTNDCLLIMAEYGKLHRKHTWVPEGTNLMVLLLCLQ